MLRTRIARLLARPIAPVSIVWVVWLAWSAAFVAAIAVYGTEVPYADEYDSWVAFLTGRRPFSPSQLVVAQNGHRLGAGFLLMWATYALTGSPILAVKHVAALLLSATAGLFLLAVRRWRGRLVATDSLIPVVFLNLGHLDSALYAMSVSWMIFMACLAGVALVAAGSPTRLSPGAAVLSTALLIVATQSMGAGVVVAAAMSPWLLFAAWPRRDDPATSARRAAARCAAVACSASVLLVAVASRPPAEGQFMARTWGEVLLSGAPHMLANMFGCLALDLWHALPMPATLLVVSSFALLARSWFVAPQERARLLAWALLLGAFCVVAVGTARVRTALHPIRYGTLMAPAFVLVYVAWSCCGVGRWATVLPWTLCVAAWVGAPWNSAVGQRMGHYRLQIDASFLTGLRDHMPVREFARRHCVHFPPDDWDGTSRLEGFLRDLHAARIGIFADLNVSDHWPGMEGASKSAGGEPDRSDVSEVDDASGARDDPGASDGRD